jgi:RNA polymerase sigma-70 factor, ECF subfamily
MDEAGVEKPSRNREQERKNVMRIEGTRARQKARAAGSATAADPEAHRAELRAHCYRMLGSALDAEDMVQETLLRAWKMRDSFDGRSSFRTWLYRIATNVCLDELRRRPRRRLPAAIGKAAAPERPVAAALEEATWIGPFPDAMLPDPESRLASSENIGLAFIAALQELSPRQRAALLLRDVLDFSAAEVAELLGTSTDAVDSSLRRARSAVEAAKGGRRRVLSPAQVALLEKYVRAWEAGNAASFARLLAEDAELSMPPVPTWFRGAANIRAFLERVIFAGRGERRLVATSANGQPAFAVYRATGPGRPLRAHRLHVVALRRGRVAQIVSFAQPKLFRLFGLPEALPRR